jgi:hypothetical protein
MTAPGGARHAHVSPKNRDGKASGQAQHRALRRDLSYRSLLATAGEGCRGRQEIAGEILRCAQNDSVRVGALARRSKARHFAEDAEAHRDHRESEQQIPRAAQGATLGMTATAEEAGTVRVGRMPLRTPAVRDSGWGESVFERGQRRRSRPRIKIAALYKSRHGAPGNTEAKWLCPNTARLGRNAERWPA